MFNGKDYLAVAIESLLAQTYTDFEIIISDNASTDGTATICEDFAQRDHRVRYYRQSENVGAARNFNKTFQLARGEYFKWHAHDDTCAPSMLERCVASLDTNPEAVLCFTRTQFIDANGQHHSSRDHPLDLETANRTERFLQFVFPGHIVVEIFGVIRSDVLRKTPLIASYIGSDLVLLAEIGLYGPFLVVSEDLFFHREHSKRSVHAYSDAKARLAWFDTSKSGHFALPTWRLIKEHMISLTRVRLPMAERARIVFGVLRKSNWQRQ
ncbi:MAG: glycosyltransferase family 2 protein [Betaproteobacteria bacterium]|nr:glycosyltransferase family 2 protein [Betaproteobacteria bacterium]